MVMEERGLFNISEVISFEVDRAPDYHTGALEAATAKIEKLVCIIGLLAEQIPDENKKRLVGLIGYGWDETNDN